MSVGQTLEETLAGASDCGQSWEPAPYGQLKSRKKASLGKPCALSTPPARGQARGYVALGSCLENIGQSRRQEAYLLLS